MNVSDTLNKAADLIEERGWRKGSAGWPGTVPEDVHPLCLEGGIIAALGKTFRTIDLTEWWACPAYTAVRDYLGITAEMQPNKSHGYMEPAEPMWRWNDKNGRTAAEVIETLRAAALVEAAREAAQEATLEPAEPTAGRS